MATLTVRNVSEKTKHSLRLRAAGRGASMEDEVRSILNAVVEAGLSVEQLTASRNDGTNAWEAIERLRGRFGTFELDLPRRSDAAGARVVFDPE